jgi:predicted transposase YbfD/YdcC
VHERPRGRLGAYFATLAAAESGLLAVALDGKTLRGARRGGAVAAHLVAVFAHRARLVLGQVAVAEKSNEIPCVRKLLKLLPRRVRLLVTVDAMHTQTALPRLICSTLKSHYLMVVKANQAGLLARITALPWAEVPVTASDDSRGHGRVETRTLQTLTAARGIGFPAPDRWSASPANGWSPRPGNAPPCRLRHRQPAVRAGPTHHDRALAPPALAHREFGALGTRYHLRRGQIHHAHRHSATGHGLPAQHRHQPAPHRRSRQHRRSLPGSPPSATTAGSTSSQTIESAGHKRASRG